jgi:dTDP-4-amino-4,6-dideoxygalactose transaminase
MTERIEFFRHALGADEIVSLSKTVDSLFLTLGPRVAEFERAFAEELRIEHVVGVSSCSMGLVLMLRALGVGYDSEVITTPMTFVATANAVLHLGARPVFVDVEPKTGLINPEAVRAAISPRTRAIVAVHLYGSLADMVALRQIADQHGVALVEDAAHAIDAERGGVRVGELGDAAVFSFYATKNLTSGDGGAVAVHDPQLAEQLRCLRNHGVSLDAATRHGKNYRHWDMVELGYKAALTDIEASLLLPQLERLAERRAQRRQLVERYEQLLGAVQGVELIPRRGRSSHHLFAVLLPRGTREQVLEGLGRRGVGCAVNYRSVHTLSYYRERFGFARDDLPVAADFGERTLSLPLWPQMPESLVDEVATRLQAALVEARHHTAYSMAIEKDAVL